MFLSKEAIVALTGRKKPKLQRAWLTDHGYHFDVRADGRPAVLVRQVEEKQGVRIDRGDEPNWAALR